MADDTHSDRLPRLAVTVWESADSPGSAGARVPGRSSSRRETDAAPCHPQCQPPPALESPRGPPREAPAANILRREVVATWPNEKWAGEITYIPTRQGWFYVAVLMDLYSRRIIGWAMGDQMTTTLTLKALEMAVQQRPVPVGLLHHSDRGCQYGATPYQRLVACGLQCSMSRPGNCWDNAVVESVFATLKTELFHARRDLTQEQARTEILAYLERFYNRTRRHSTLGYLSPVKCEQRAVHSTSGVY